MGVKVAVVGAGSTYTPELVEGFARRTDRFPVDHLALLDIDPERLSIVGALADRMLRKAGWPGELRLTGDRDEALEGVDFVIVQLRVGGQRARYQDETIPGKFGCIGQETTGPGGFAKGLRTIPVVLELAEETARRGAPGAWFVDFTNPTGMVTQALLDEGHRALGLCNVAIGFQRAFARLLGVEPARVLVDQVGLNHLTWVRAAWVEERDVLPELLADHGDELAGMTGGLPRQLLDELGVVPSYYLRYFYEHDQVLESQRTAVPRALTVAEIEGELLDLYRDPDVVEKPALLERRGGAFYSEAAIGLVTSLAGDAGDVQVVDIRNGQTLAGLAEDDVVEVPAKITSAGAVPVPQAPLAPELLGLTQHVAAYERLTALAAVSHDPLDARKALLAHPLIGQVELVDELVERLALPGRTTQEIAS
jgi:6-phospho-beta-glucosidase